LHHINPEPFDDPNNFEAVLSCRTNGNQFIVDNNPDFSASESTFGACLLQNRGSAIATTTSCGGGAGKIIKVGFDLYKVCYDEGKSAPIYAVHDLHGASKRMDKGKESFYFKHDGQDFFKTVASIDDVYRRQKQRLINIVGPNYYNSEITQSLDKGHLAPFADFSMQSWQYASNFYINVVPQWSGINTGSWKSLEMMIRSDAQKTKKTYKIYTGTFDTLVLNLKPIELYFDQRTNENRVPIPKYVWKLVIDENAKSGIGFLSLNDPFVEPDVQIVDPCRNICSDYNWNHTSFSRLSISSGYLICCDIGDMARIIPIISGLGVNVSNVLQKT
jgi:DNA/RNA endonuclease G (NUC1)